MQKEFIATSRHLKRDLIIIIAVAIVVLILGLLTPFQVVLFALVSAIVYYTSRKETKVEITDEEIKFYYRKKIETVPLKDILLIEIEPRKASYKTMSGTKNLHLEGRDQVVTYNVINIYNENLSDAILELSKAYNFSYFNEHKDMKNPDAGISQ